MKNQGAAVVKLNAFLTLRLDGGDGSESCCSRELNLPLGHQARSLITKLSVIRRRFQNPENSFSSHIRGLRIKQRKMKRIRHKNFTGTQRLFSADILETLV